MKPPTKRVLICAGLVVYLSGYVAARINGELIHRHTWDGGWSRHWIVPAATDSETRLAVAAMVLSGNPNSQEVQQRALNAIDGIDRRRRVFQCLFIPLVIGESAMHWVIAPRG